MPRKKQSSGDRIHPYMKGFKREGWKTSKIRRFLKDGIVQWVQVFQNGTLTFSNKKS